MPSKLGYPAGGLQLHLFHCQYACHHRPSGSSEAAAKYPEAYALILACGIDPEKSITFIQSHVKTHAELTWVLNCFTQFGELSRMTQFKDKSARYADNINAGLFDYPVLMAADILLYKADLVPVGIDQKQHLELCRDVAQRFNGVYGNVFTIPDAYIPKAGQNHVPGRPHQKDVQIRRQSQRLYFYSGSARNHCEKFKRAVTDSEMEVAYREGKDGINNLMTIYSVVTGKTLEEIQTSFPARVMGTFKVAVGEAVAEHLRPVRERFDALMKDKAYLEDCYQKGPSRLWPSPSGYWTRSIKRSDSSNKQIKRAPGHGPVLFYPYRRISWTVRALIKIRSRLLPKSLPGYGGCAVPW